MQDSPGVDHVEGAQTPDILVIQDRTLLNRPFTVTGKIAVAQSCRAEHGILIEIERMHTRAEFASGKRKQTAARTNIEKTQTREGIPFEQSAKRTFCFGELICA